MDISENSSEQIMTNYRLNAILPILLSLAVIVLAFLSPEMVAAMGCSNRGLLALGIALLSGLCGICAGGMAVMRRIGGKESGGLILAAALYTLPILLVLTYA